MDTNRCTHALHWTRNAYGHLSCTDCGTALTVSKPRADANGRGLPGLKLRTGRDVFPHRDSVRGGRRTGRRSSATRSAGLFKHGEVCAQLPAESRHGDGAMKEKP